LQLKREERFFICALFYLLYLWLITKLGWPKTFTGVNIRQDFTLIIVIFSVIIFLIIFRVAGDFIVKKVIAPPKKDFMLRSGLFVIDTFILYLLAKITKLIFEKSASINTDILILLIFTTIVVYTFFLFRAAVFFLWLGKLFPEQVSQTHFSSILAMPNFIEHTKDLLAITKRLGSSVGLLAIKVTTDEKTTKESFLRKQTLYLLTHNNRRYEQWSRTPDKKICICALVVSNKTELDLATERIKRLLLSHLSLPEGYLKVKIKSASTIIDTVEPLTDLNLEIKKLIESIEQNV